MERKVSNFSTEIRKQNENMRRKTEIRRNRNENGVILAETKTEKTTLSDATDAERKFLFCLIWNFCFTV
jgi:hypothetical protein